PGLEDYFERRNGGATTLQTQIFTNYFNRLLRLGEPCFGLGGRTFETDAFHSPLTERKSPWIAIIDGSDPWSGVWGSARSER
ncbi:MAG TPA: hypothetical protein PLJ27_20070, partial [Polyangiaceae bacterium]|nr:hypothetical protein [Polyangiaceae bacterium]